ncbi:hypothetical protein PGT21_026348 [Puccinia graminis f. sp. tritici]|uniref:Pet127-domain-containing protein n=2 Tax=Puccinia graminis f. sp. tritici TaxID=56615 RepID=E3KQG9_PUCGT|nr:uncharacterized protein PGTG_12500 [Puccinia graminis f. sp. tritici CRL 75-36-700-3]EFP86544.2 hypothetical protein PGTG_12500 [Puccinia graminis f. sp. tritici CRL 75-36-700-3]KAA1113249.1 hypothetical protein PGT21_026348 [Puccinia graminis f. sp. tritici]KAA1113613.1 hypothetical protein PGTUg99_007626 [Puccinia graminis f. sp. tritici]
MSTYLRTHHPKLKLTLINSLARNGRTQELIARRNLSTNPTSTQTSPFISTLPKRTTATQEPHPRTKTNKTSASKISKSETTRNQPQNHSASLHSSGSTNLPPSRKKLTTSNHDNHHPKRTHKHSSSTNNQLDSPKAPRSITPFSTLSKRNGKRGQEEDEQDSLATDRLTKNPSLDLTQLPEPSSSQTTQPYTSFSFSSSSIPFEAVTPSAPQPPVATLAHGLSRVLFNPGVHWLQDPRTLVYNFDHRLQDLVAPDQFNFDALTPYVTSSRDEQLVQLAHQNLRKYCGSTSSMTQTLSQIYLMLNGNKPLNIGMLTANAASTKKKVEFTPGAKMPASIILKYDPETKRYSIDSDKSFDTETDCPDSTILSSLGHVLEKFFVLPYEEFAKLLKKNANLLDPSKPKLREAYAFAKTNLLMTRSQLDCYHHYLPGNGTFDIKTRATIAIRHDRLNHANAAGYQIRTSQGPLESFEREYLDLIRSAFLKYQFQARIGQMDGCFVAYHNTQRVFGFEYLPISKMDQALFGNSQEGDKVFKLCLGYMERILEDATQAYPEQSLRITTSAKSHGNLWVFVSPDQGEITSREPPEDYTTFHYKNYNYLDGEIVEESYIDIESSHQARIVRGGGLEDKEFGVVSSEEDREKIDWSIFCQTFKYPRSEELDQLYRSIRKIQFAISQLVLPEGVDRQLMRIVNWPETANELQESSTSDDDLSPSSSSPLGSSPKTPTSPASSTHTFVPTPGIKYKTEVSKLVKHLRSIAKDGWKFQHQLVEAQKDQKVISLKPAEFSIQDRQPSLSNRLPSTSPPSSSTSSASHSNSDWQNHLIAQERQRQIKALDILSSVKSNTQ